MKRVEEFQIKHQRLMQIMDQAQVDAVLLRRRANFSWLTCGGRNHVNTAADTGAAAVFITAKRCCLLASNIEAERLMLEELADLPLEPVVYPWHEPRAESSVLSRLAAGLHVAVDVSGASSLPGTGRELTRDCEAPARR